jgi:hypothetical protein
MLAPVMSSLRQRDFGADIIALRSQLADVLGALKTLADAVSAGERNSFTLTEFRHRNGLSESQFFKLVREGRGPKLMSVGSLGKRISRASERDWTKARERDVEGREAPKQ